MQQSGKWVPRLLIGLTVAFLTLFLIVPLLFVLAQAFSRGLGVYLSSITDTYAMQALALTLVTVLVAVAVNTIFGLFAAWSLTRYRFFGYKILNTFVDLPLSVSPVIAGLIFLLTFGRFSPIYPLLTMRASAWCMPSPALCWPPFSSPCPMCPGRSSPCWTPGAPTRRRPPP